MAVYASNDTWDGCGTLPKRIQNNYSNETIERVPKLFRIEEQSDFGNQ